MLIYVLCRKLLFCLGYLITNQHQPSAKGQGMMKTFVFGLCLFVSMLSSIPAFAQVIMLPTIDVFSVDTAVAVPDGGSMLLGGNTSMASGSITRGPFPKNRGIGSQGHVAGATVHVKIIDLAELDKAILEAAQNETLAGKRMQDSAPGAQAKGNSPAKSLSSSTAKNNVPELTGASRAWNPADKGNKVRSSSKYAITHQGPNQRKADYDYMMILSHPNHPEVAEDLLAEISNDIHQARDAKSDGRWSTAQLFYEQAWGRLSPDQQRAALTKMKVSPPGHTMNKDSEKESARTTSKSTKSRSN